jgi:hypothetical protein
LGQTKNEKEVRVQLSEFPELTQNTVNALPKDCKRIKFYKETDSDKLSFEVKFKYHKQRYSIEFSETGQIEDIEIITKFKNIAVSTKSKIKDYLNQSYSKHKFIKIQRQYVYSSDGDTSLFLTNVLSEQPSLPHNFEIIAEVKSKKLRDIREFTFNNQGTFINSRILIPTSYEHVLY